MNTSLVLPQGARESLLMEQQVEHFKRRGADLEAFDRALKDIDPRLSLVRASESATLPGLTPGYWHVQRRNDPPAMDSYLILTGPGGEFTEPHSGLLEWLRSRDLQNPDVVDNLQRQAFAKERARQAAVENAKEDRMDEFLDRYKTKTGTSISVKRAA